MYKQVIRPFFFQFNAEDAHYKAMKSASLVNALPGGTSILKKWAGYKQTIDPVHFMGLPFRNRIGMAAGFDKNGQYVNVLQALGFSHIEVGTVTPRPQLGNPRPRLFRLKEDLSLINRMGFNNEGVHALHERLVQLGDQRPIIGGNIGKNKNTTNEDAWKDYVYCTKVLHDQVDYFTVNVSSPNTPGLRALQDKDALMKILSEVQEYNFSRPTPKPILLKIAPDNDPTTDEDIVEVITACKLHGIVATNTTIDRSGLKTSNEMLADIGAGGLSGAALRKKSPEVVARLKKLLPNDKIIIAAGGISTAEDYQHMLHCGADLVQVYTGFIYEGPQIVKQLLR